MMMKVGLEMSAGSMPRPIATPRATTVFPVPSSPESANTSFGCAARPRRSPRRSVCRDEWLTRSSEATVRCWSATRHSAAELSALEEESDRNAEERAEERGPNREPPFLRDLTEKLHPFETTERAAQRDESEGADEGAALAKRELTRVECLPSLVLGTLLALFRLRPTVLGRIAPFAAPSTSCHERRLALAQAGDVGARYELFAGLHGFEVAIGSARLIAFCQRRTWLPIALPRVLRRRRVAFSDIRRSEHEQSRRRRVYRGARAGHLGERPVDRQDGIVRPRYDAVERRAHRPAVDDRGDVKVAIDGCMEQPTVDGGGHAPREAPPGPGQDGARDHVGADADAQLATQILRGETETPCARHAERARHRRASRNDVAGTDRLADLRSFGHADRQRMIRGPALALPRHDVALAAAVAPTASCHPETAGIRSLSRAGSESGLPRASMRTPRAPERP